MTERGQSPLHGESSLIQALVVGLWAFPGLAILHVSAIAPVAHAIIPVYLVWTFVGLMLRGEIRRDHSV